MRAVICKTFGPADNMIVEERPDPIPAQDEVVIETQASVVNFVDTLLVQDKYQMHPTPPFSPGSGVAGKIKAIGNAVDAFRIGERVMATFAWGGFAEAVAAKAEAVTRIPDNVDPATAVSAFTSYATSYYALADRAKMKAGESLLVLGAAGGVGAAAVELGRLFGARVTAAASSEEKLAYAKALGATQTVRYPIDVSGREAQKALGEAFKKPEPEGFDVIYDPIGGDYAEPAVRSMAWDGRYLVVGFAAGPIPRIPLNLVLLKSCNIVGVFVGAMSYRDKGHAKRNGKQIMDWLAAGKLKPTPPVTYPLERAAEALKAIGNRQISGRVVLTTGRS